MRSILTLSLVLTAGSLASPAARRRAAIPGTDLRLELDVGGDLWIKRGTVRARIPVDLPYPDFFVDLGATATPATVTVKAEANCEGRQTLTLARARLEALLENAAARSHFRAKQWEPAAAGFARALELEPTFAEAATNLAAAQARSGHAADAVATLTGAAERDAIWVAWRLAADPDLAGPAAAPALAKAFAPAPNDPAPRALDSEHVTFSPSRGLYAWRRVVDNQMTERSNRDVELWIADLATDTVRARLGYGHDRRGATAITRTLAMLGFTETVKIDRTEEIYGAGKVEVAFPSTDLKVAFAVVAHHDEEVLSGTVRLSRNGRVVGTAHFKKPKGADSPPWLKPWAAPIPGAVIVGASVNIGEGCGAYYYDDVLRILLPPER